MTEVDLSAVGHTAVLTVRARAEEHRRKDRLFEDPVAETWSQALPWSAAHDEWYSDFAQAKTAIRAAQFDEIAQAKLQIDPNLTIVELGCGFSTRYERLGRPTHYFELDRPDVMAARAVLSPERRGPTTLSTSVLDEDWLDAVEVSGPVLLIAEGLLYYLARPDVEALFARLRQRFPGALVVFDVIGPFDFPKSVTASTKFGAPILWMVEPSFEAAYSMFGLEPDGEFDSKVVLQRTVDAFSGRFGPLMGGLLRGLASVRPLANLRSGIVVGRLRPD